MITKSPTSQASSSLMFIKNREVLTWLSHLRSGQTQQLAKLSLTPKHRAENSGSSILQRPLQLYPFITRLNTISLLHWIFSNSHPKNMSPPFRLFNYPQNFISSEPPLCQSSRNPSVLSSRLSHTLHTYWPPFSVLFFFTSRFSLWLTPQVCLAPHLSAATSSSITHQCSAAPFHQSRHHLLAIPSQTSR